MKLVVLFLVAVFYSFLEVADSASSCDIKVLNSPIKDSEIVQYNRYSSYQDTCKFTTSCPVDVYISHMSEDKENFLPISSPYWYFNKSLIFREVAREIERNRKYEVDMIIRLLSTSAYNGNYYCIIKDRSNSSNNVSVKFLSLQIKPNVEEIIGECYSPKAENITAFPTYYSNGSLSVTLTWKPSVKESDNVPYCESSRKWKVRLQEFSSIDSTPADNEIKEISSYWTNVLSPDTTFTFTQLLNNHTYYQFQIANNATHFNDRRTFGSYIYYFGKQTLPVIENKQKSTYTINEMGSVSIPCYAIGNPLPSVKWVSSTTGIIKPDSNGVLRINNATMSHKGNYFCIAESVIVNPPNGKTPKVSIWSITIDVKAYDRSSGELCDKAFTTSGLHCEPYLHTHFPIYTNLTDTRDKNFLAGTKMTNINQYVPFGKCRNLVYSILCHTYYPYCDVSQSVIPKPRSICNDSCNQFISGNECGQYASQMKQQDSELYKLLVSRCDRTHLQGGDAPECTPLSTEASKNDQTETITDTGSCIRGNGRGYTGNQVRTQSNSLCQLWSMQSPHKHPMLPSIYASELSNAGYACRNPGGLGTRPWCYTNDPVIRWDYCDIPKCDTCELYNGSICSSIAGYRNGKVYIRKGKNINSWKDIEGKILSSITASRFHHRPSEGCEKIFQMLLCHSSFPSCSDNKPKSLCSDHCRLRKSLQDLCPDTFTEYEKFVKDNSDFLSEIECTNCRKDALRIPPLSNKDSKPANATESCYNNSGINYRGNTSTTVNNQQCQTWDSDQHIFMSDRYPELANAKNYCRNPGGIQSRPWCYIDSDTWEYCDISLCTGKTKTVLVPDAADPVDDQVVDSGPRSQATALVYAFTITLAMFVIAIICAVVVLVFLKKRRRMLKLKKNMLEKAAPNIMKDDKFVANPDYNRINPITSNDSRIPENFRMLEAKQIKYISQLGQGNFGIVFKGRAFNITPDEEEIEVAVKTLKEETSTEIIQNFIDEAKLLFTFDHPNILSIYGVCMTEMPYQMVFEYMNEGDLTQFLRLRASSTQRRLLNAFNYRSRTESSFSNDPPSLSKSQLLHICNQIANGMKYLSGKNHVHRDLACRNCLIKSDLTVKIGDFGMSRNLYSKDYYRINGHAVLPVRWMSPESLIYGKFSIEGDVWSFGIVMWEVFSFALQPYYGISNEEVTEAIRHGKTLHRPDDCPVEVYKIMKECWNMDSMERPTFEELYAEISHLYQSSSEQDYNDIDDDDHLDSLSYDSDAFYSEDTLSMDCVSNDNEL